MAVAVSVSVSVSVPMSVVIMLYTTLHQTPVHEIELS